jgi:hypothetical protein
MIEIGPNLANLLGGLFGVLAIVCIVYLANRRY